jgi:hypothetical protein
MAGIRQLGLGKTLPAIAPRSFSPTEAVSANRPCCRQVPAELRFARTQRNESTLDLVGGCLAGGVRIRR